jgi:uncharacterized membrane protein
MGTPKGRLLKWREKMKTIAKMITASAAALSTLAFVTIAAPAAHAGEFCSVNTSGMRGCGFSTLEQCQATVSGIGSGPCIRDPFYKNTNALAYQPKHGRARGELRPTNR